MAKFGGGLAVVCSLAVICKFTEIVFGKFGGNLAVGCYNLALVGGNWRGFGGLAGVCYI